MGSSPYPCFALLIHAGYRKIVTHYAEDGSGIGSTIIAGRALHFLIEILLYSHGHPKVITKARWDAGLYHTV